jgi:hypothetical protein
MDEETVLKFGKYRNKKIKDIPASYILTFIENGGDHVDLRNYALNNRESLINKALLSDKLTKEDLYKLTRMKYRDGFNDAPQSQKGVIKFCSNKFSYASQVDAKKELKRIRSISPDDKKIPVRTYYCEGCSAWHLTSKPLDKFKD